MTGRYVLVGYEWRARDAGDPCTDPESGGPCPDPDCPYGELVETSRETLDVEEFLRVNAEAFESGTEEAEIRALQPGQHMWFGGGAQPYFEVHCETDDNDQSGTED